MTFYTSSEVTLLFSSWRTENQAQYRLALLMITLLGVFHSWVASNGTEFLVGLFCPQSDRSSRPSDASNGVGETLLSADGTAHAASRTPRLWLRVLVFVSSVLQHSLHFVLMLLAMSFEVGVFSSVVLGLALGHAIFCRDHVGSAHRHAN